MTVCGNCAGTGRNLHGERCPCPSGMASATFPVHLTHMEIAGTLAALRTVLDTAPHGKPRPLLDAESKLAEALRG